MIKAIAVFCGSQSGKDAAFETDAIELGKLLVQKNITLIYGGGNKGLMGAVANAVMDNHGKVIGIIPQVLKEWEAHHTGITELMVVDDMHTRKKMLYEKCDAAVVLPGGFGTLDELYEMLTWNQLSIHNKKIYIVNVNGFYNHLLLHNEQMQNQGFLYDKLEERITVLSNSKELENYL